MTREATDPLQYFPVFCSRRTSDINMIVGYEWYDNIVLYTRLSHSYASQITPQHIASNRWFINNKLRKPLLCRVCTYTECSRRYWVVVTAFGRVKFEFLDKPLYTKNDYYGDGGCLRPLVYIPLRQLFCY